MSNLGQNKFWKSIDMPIILLYIALVLIGWLNIYAAVFDESHASIFDLEKNYGKQLLWIATALFIGLMVLLIDSKFFSVFAFGIYGITLIMLVSVLFFGKYVNGSRSWFEIGSFRLQPAEFAKFATALALAKVMERPTFDLSKRNYQAIAFGVLLVPIALILLQPDTGTAMVYFSLLIMFYREGLPQWYYVLGIGSVSITLLALGVDNNLYLAAIIILVVGGLIYLGKKFLNIK